MLHSGGGTKGYTPVQARKGSPSDAESGSSGGRIHEPTQSSRARQQPVRLPAQQPLFELNGTLPAAANPNASAAAPAAEQRRVQSEPSSAVEAVRVASVPGKIHVDRSEGRKPQMVFGRRVEIPRFKAEGAVHRTGPHRAPDDNQHERVGFL